MALKLKIYKSPILMPSYLFWGQILALECFPTGDGSLWENAWFYEVSNFLISYYPPFYCFLRSLVKVTSPYSLTWSL